MYRPIPGLTIEEQPEAIVVCLALWGEARGESPEGKLGVLYVLHNRAKRRSKSLKEIALQPLQFSTFNEDDPNRARLLKADQSDLASWAACEAIYGIYEAGWTTDPTLGSTHYFAHNIVTPKWGPGHPDWIGKTVIGRHTFGVAA